MRGSAYYDKGEYDIAIADFNDALRIGPPSGIIFHNRGNAWRSKGDYASARSPTTTQAIRLRSDERLFVLQNRGRRGRRSATSTARSPISTRRSGSIRRCPRR